jgi:protein involved in polysaccharide export with SLBB domain
MVALCLGAGAVIVNAQSSSLQRGDAGNDRAMVSYFGARNEKPEGPAIAIEDSLLFLSPGDQLKLRWWGVGSGSEDLMVNTRWEIVIPDRGVIKTKGIPFTFVRDSIETMIRTQIKVKMIDLQLVAIMPARIQITGQVPRPGNFEVAAGTRLSDAVGLAGVSLRDVLYAQASGTPSRPGDRQRIPSVRRVQLVRAGGKDTVWCDLAKAWNAASATDNPRLFSGDQVKLLLQGPLLAVSGDVPYAGYMEMIPGETLASFLSIAGAENIAGCEAMMRDGSRRKMESSMRLDTSCTLLELPPLRYRPIVPMVWVTGYVHQPGGFLLKEGMTVRSAIALAGGMLGPEDSGVAVGVKRGWGWLQPGRRQGFEASSQHPEVRMALASYYVSMRGNYSDPNALLQAGDSIFVHQVEKVVWVGGKVNRPGFVEWKAGATDHDYVIAAGGYADRSWEEKTQIFDLFSDQPVPRGQPIRPSSAVIVPEQRYLYFDQWISLGATVVSAVVSMVYLYVALGTK